MATHKEIMRLAVDVYNGSVQDKFSDGDKTPEEALRGALIAANGGSDKVSLRSMRDGKNMGLFRIIEESIDKLIVEGLTGDEFFTQIVDYRNVALGDAIQFDVKDDSLFAVSDVAAGIQGVRRQRLNAGEEIIVKTTPKVIKIYEEINRLLAGRISWVEFIDRVGKSFKKKSLDDILSAFTNLVTGLQTPYTTTGSYSDSDLLEIVQHVESATGQKANIVGTAMALKNVNTETVRLSETAKDDLYRSGYFKLFEGRNVIALPQVHKTGTDDFLLPNDKIFVFPSDDNPIKYVTEGQTFINDVPPTVNADLSQEFVCIDTYGIAVVTNKKFGAFVISTTVTP